MRFQRRSWKSGPFSAIWTATILSKGAFCREWKTEQLSPLIERQVPFEIFEILLIFCFSFLLSARARARAPTVARQPRGWAGSPTAFKKVDENPPFCARAFFFRPPLFLNSAFNGESFRSVAAHTAENRVKRCFYWRKTLYMNIEGFTSFSGIHYVSSPWGIRSQNFHNIKKII